LRKRSSISTYIEAMRQIQPQGPYYIGGWSLGGIIAESLREMGVGEYLGFILNEGKKAKKGDSNERYDAI
jgi:hypothetical protein